MASYHCSVAPGEIAGEMEQPGEAQRLGAIFQRKDEPLTRERRRLNLDSENIKNGLAQLVLTLVKLLHELLEKQAIRRIESGRVTEADCERMGLALMRQSEQIEQLRQAFGLSEEDLNLDLGPLGKLL